MQRLLIVVLLSAAACGGSGAGEPEISASTTEPVAPYSAQVASYDLAADRPQRFLVGLVATEGGIVVGGSVKFDFEPPAGTTAVPSAQIDDVTGTFVTVADGLPADTGPRLRQGKEGVGVYEATNITFGTPGQWTVTVSGLINGETVSLPATFDVLAAPLVPAIGDIAPLTRNVMPGDTSEPVKALDSRAEADGSIPDPELHRITVADAVATGLPTVVVISTPVFCVSRFCGPITDTVSAIADEFEGRANFVHIEVWREYEKNVLNRGAADWIYRSDDAEGTEPWVFVIAGDGIIARRWDNVANGTAIRASLTELTA